MVRAFLLPRHLLIELHQGLIGAPLEPVTLVQPDQQQQQQDRPHQEGVPQYPFLRDLRLGDLPVLLLPHLLQVHALFKIEHALHVGDLLLDAASRIPVAGLVVQVQEEIGLLVAPLQGVRFAQGLGRLDQTDHVLVLVLLACFQLIAAFRKVDGPVKIVGPEIDLRHERIGSHHVPWIPDQGPAFHGHLHVVQGGVQRPRP